MPGTPTWAQLVRSISIYGAVAEALQHNVQRDALWVAHKQKVQLCARLPAKMLP